MMNKEGPVTLQQTLIRNARENHERENRRLRELVAVLDDNNDILTPKQASEFLTLCKSLSYDPPNFKVSR